MTQRIEHSLALCVLVAATAGKVMAASTSDLLKSRDAAHTDLHSFPRIDDRHAA